MGICVSKEFPFVSDHKTPCNKLWRKQSKEQTLFVNKDLLKFSSQLKRQTISWHFCMIVCQVINLLAFSERTMSQNQQAHINVFQHYGRELARIGDLTNMERRNNWNFAGIARLTGCASFGFTTGLAMFWLFLFVRKKIMKSKWIVDYS